MRYLSREEISGISFRDSEIYEFAMSEDGRSLHFVCGSVLLNDDEVVERTTGLTVRASSPIRVIRRQGPVFIELDRGYGGVPNAILEFSIDQNRFHLAGPSGLDQRWQIYSGDIAHIEAWIACWSSDGDSP